MAENNEVALTVLLDDVQETKALLIQMREYVFKHSLQIGECVAWTTLKAKYGVGDNRMRDIAWLQDYLKHHPQSAALTGPVHYEAQTPEDSTPSGGETLQHWSEGETSWTTVWSYDGPESHVLVTRRDRPERWRMSGSKKGDDHSGWQQDIDTIAEAIAWLNEHSTLNFSSVVGAVRDW